jgi:hypothetical protein
MTIYLMYKNKLNNMEDKRLPKIAWIIKETILQNKDTIKKKNVKSKFKEKMWCDKDLEEKIKLRYYKDVINPNLEDQNYLSILPSVKKKNRHC